MHNYDILDGPECYLAYAAVCDELLHKVAAGEYAACIACPMCSTFSKLLNLPGTPALRDASGPGRYGKKGLTPAQKEKVRLHTLVAVRVAQVLTLLTVRMLPWIFEAPHAIEKQVSVLNLDGYTEPPSRPDVVKIIGAQCPFGVVSSKPTAWAHHRAVLSGMPMTCPHAKKICLSIR